MERLQQPYVDALRSYISIKRPNVSVRNLFPWRPTQPGRLRHESRSRLGHVAEATAVQDVSRVFPHKSNRGVLTVSAGPPDVSPHADEAGEPSHAEQRPLGAGLRPSPPGQEASPAAL